MTATVKHKWIVVRDPASRSVVHGEICRVRGNFAYAYVAHRYERQPEFREIDLNNPKLEILRFQYEKAMRGYLDGLYAKKRPAAK
jgi:hypothetical protein